MKTYYVATLARYVLVDADTDAEARRLGHAALHELYADVRERLGRDVPIDIQVIREAYIKSQQHEGWVCSASRYDDGGFTGAKPGGLAYLLASLAPSARARAITVCATRLPSAAAVLPTVDVKSGS